MRSFRHIQYSRKFALILFFLLTILFLLGIPSKFVKTGNELLELPSKLQTYKYIAVGDIIKIPVPTGQLASNLEFGVLGEKSKLDYVTQYDLWDGIRTTNARALKGLASDEFILFLASKPQQLKVKSRPYRLFSLEKSSGNLFELPPQLKSWSSSTQFPALARSKSGKKLAITLAAPRSISIPVGIQLNSLVQANSFRLPLSIQESADVSQIYLRVEKLTTEPLQLPLQLKSTETARLRSSSKRADFRSADLMAAVVAGQKVGSVRIERKLPEVPGDGETTFPTVTPTASPSPSATLVPSPTATTAAPPPPPPEVSSKSSSSKKTSSSSSKSSVSSSVSSAQSKNSGSSISSSKISSSITTTTTTTSSSSSSQSSLSSEVSTSSASSESSVSSSVSSESSSSELSSNSSSSTPMGKCVRSSPLDASYGLVVYECSSYWESADPADVGGDCTDDKQCSYNACTEAGTCEPFPGQAAEGSFIDCSSNSAICGKTSCNSDDTCSMSARMSGDVSPNECSAYDARNNLVSEDCKTRKICQQYGDEANGPFVCAPYDGPVAGTRERGCESDPDCENTVKVCGANGICGVKKGPIEEGDTGCSNVGDYDPACIRKVCQAGSGANSVCVPKGPLESINEGEKECKEDSDCNKVCLENLDSSGNGIGTYVCAAPDNGVVPSGAFSCDYPEDCEFRKICQGASCANVKGPKKENEKSCGSNPDCSKICTQRFDIRLGRYYDTCTYSSDLTVQDHYTGPSCSEVPDCRFVPWTPRSDSASLSLTQLSSIMSSENSIELQKTVSSEVLAKFKDSPVQVEVFQDLRCGMCKRNHKLALKQALKDNNIEIKFREFPLGFRSEESKLAVAAICAGQQGKYEEFVDEIYSNWHIKSNDLSETIESLNLNPTNFKSCQDSPESLLQVRKDYKEGLALGITGTPTYLINSKVYPGARDYEGLIELIESAYK